MKNVQSLCAMLRICYQKSQQPMWKDACVFEFRAEFIRRNRSRNLFDNRNHVVNNPLFRNLKNGENTNDRYFAFNFIHTNVKYEQMAKI